MENNNGADKLITSILQEAHEQASAIEWKSAETVAELKKKLERDLESVRDEFTKKAADAKEMQLATARTNAELQGRKELLARKRALIGEAYSAAYKRICALTGEKREALIKKLLERECEGGETVRPAAKDRDMIAALLPVCKKTGLALGEADPEIEDGFSLTGKNYYKDCSFKALLDEVWTLTESEVTGKLFGADK